MANSIPRLVGDSLSQAATANTSNGQVLLLVNNYESLDNNREIKRIFPHEIPAWIKNVVIANNLRPTESDVCAGTLSPSTNYPTGQNSAAGDTKDPYPLGTLWVNCLENSTLAGSPDESGMPPDPLYEFFVLVASPKIDTSLSVATWVRISLEDEVSNHKCSSVRSFSSVTNLDYFGTTAEFGQNEMFAFLPNTSVTFTNQQETVATQVTDTNAAWFVKNYRFGNYVQQTAIKLDNPYYQIHRSCNVTDEGIVWSSWKTVDLRSNVPVGSIIMYSGATAPDGWLFCRGQAVNIADYQELYDVIGDRYKPVDAVLQNGKFMLPDLSSRVPQGLPSGAAPAYVPAGLPNIKGDVGGFNTWIAQGGSTEGAFYNAYAIRGGDVRGGGGRDYSYQAKFDANKYNSIYRDSVTTVQPPAVLLNFIIKYN